CTKHCVHLGVWIDLSQAPWNVVVYWQNKYMVEHISFCFCVCSITSSQIIVDCVCSIYQLGRLVVGIQQCLCIFILLYVFALGLGGRIVSIVVTVGFLAEVVLWVTVVSAPTVHSDRVEMWLINFLSGALDISLDFQFDEVIAQAVGNGLSKNVCTVQRYLVS